ncbi:latexin isoform X1 [Centroberyx affinis]|uniref:latexin isoform X1 n=2 Tax=Centroberyx affinis TaxID=166261 RepID=UPI003A5C2354
MSLRIFITLAVLAGIHGSPTITVRPGSEALDVSAHPNSVPETAEGTEEEVLVEEGTEEEVMATGELNPSHYPAQRAAKVVQHYLNTRYGSPYRWVGLHRVHSANAEDVADSGRKYRLEISVQEMISNATEKCSAELLLPGAESSQSSPQVQASCEALLKIDTAAQEEALYQQYKKNNSLLSGQNLPDSYGHIDPEMKPLWHLGGVASSFVMLKESTENTLYSMAQVANVTQLETENNQLRFNYHVLLHDMVSQEIIHWKLLVTWSPAEGVKVLQTEKLPKCHDCEAPPNTN